MTQVDHAAWTTTVSPDALANWLKQAGTVTLLTHARPDGDASGSTLALCRTLRVVAAAAVLLSAGAGCGGEPDEEPAKHLVVVVERDATMAMDETKHENYNTNVPLQTRRGHLHFF